MIHPHTELHYIPAKKGYGVLATQFIPKGTITWVSDELDQVFRPAHMKELPLELRSVIDEFGYRDSEGNFILCWDHARYMNHSFDANCISTPYNFELAVRDIEPGEELTNDYGYLNISRTLAFLPENGSARTIVTPDDLLHYHTEWDGKLVIAFRHFNTVAQPLAKFIGGAYVEKVKAISAGKEAMDSILNCYYSRQKNKEAA